MKQSLAETLIRLPGLDRRNAAKTGCECKICGGRARFFDVVDFNKHCSELDMYAFGPSEIDVSYFRCTRCGFLFTNFFDDWTAADFSRFIYNADYAKVDAEYASIRPNAVALDMAERFKGCEAARILDYGMGTGAFAERMRAFGFARIESYDPLAGRARPEGPFDIVTCFEVIEHTPSPVEAVQDMKTFLAPDGCIIFSQTLQPPDIQERRGSWWYLGPRNGHMSTFRPESLAALADATGLVFHLGASPYALSRPSNSQLAERVLATMGTPFFFRRLCAPPESVQGGTEQWHSFETSAEGSYRWTRADAVHWTLHGLSKVPCTVKLAIPFIHQIAPDFASHCAVRVQSRTTPAALDGNTLLAELALDEPGGEVVVTLLTPEPRTPEQPRDIPDERRLGLAIEAEA